jgi:hypothetical protein
VASPGMLHHVALTRATQHNIPEDAILRSHCRENLNFYKKNVQFLISPCPCQLWDPPAFCQIGVHGSVSRGKEAAFSAKVKDVQSFVSTPPYVFMTWCVGTQDNFVTKFSITSGYQVLLSLISSFMLFSVLLFVCVYVLFTLLAVYFTIDVLVSYILVCFSIDVLYLMYCKWIINGYYLMFYHFSLCLQQFC